MATPELPDLQVDFLVKEESGGFTNPNPWFVQSLDDFLFYCCPECDYKSQFHNAFHQHAVDSHLNVSLTSILSLFSLLRIR